MSPEQAAGDLDQLGPRSDVYSLGATLYFLLTGKPAQEGHDIGELLRRVQRGDFVRPRQLVAPTDPPLEAICLKAMALKAQDRYASPRLLADDIERWMADEPVTAYRDPRSRRVRRWAKRNRTIVATAAVALLAGVVGLSGVLAVQTQAKADISRALVRETQARNALADANRKVQARYELAMDAIKTFHTGVSEDFLLKQEQFKELRDRLLKSAAEFYGLLGSLLGEETDLGSRRALAAVNFELAELTAKVGRTEDALSTHRSVLAAREALASEPGAGAGANIEVGRSLFAVAQVLGATRRTAEALAVYRRAEALLAGLAGTDPEARAALAACRTRMASLLASTGESARALATYRLARSEQEILAAAPIASTNAQRDLADTINRIGNLLLLAGKPAEAEAEYRRAVAIREKLAAADPAVVDFRSGLAKSRHNLGILLAETGRPADAEGEYRKALALEQKLADDNPAVTEFRNSLALTHDRFGFLLWQTGRLAEADAENRKAMALQQELAEDNPAVTEFRTRLALSHNSLGILLMLRGRAAEAEAEFREAMAIGQKLVDEDPTIPEYRLRVIQSLVNLGDLLTDTGHAVEAIDYFVRSRDNVQALIKENPSLSYYRDGLAFSLSGLGRARRRVGDRRAAAADLRRAIALRDGLAAMDFEARYDLARDHAVLAGLAGEGDSGVAPAVARAHSDRAMDVLKRLVSDGYRNPKVSTQSDLDPLRHRPDFQRLLLDVTFPVAPFAVTH
jgi:tetratricopeptide (TPR) repeat protein